MSKLKRITAASLAGLSILPFSAEAGGVVTNATVAALLAALNGGGTVTFSATGTVVISRTITISAPTTLIDSNHAIVLSGGTNAVPIFSVNADAQLTLQGVTIANGRGTNGGAIYNLGTVILANCTLSNNIAIGATGAMGFSGSFGAIRGTDGSPAGAGVPGSGGALFNLGKAIVSGCTFVTNQVSGGAGGIGGAGGGSNYQGGNGGDGGPGGAGMGGAIYSSGYLVVSNTWFKGNLARGGSGGAGGTNGAGAVPSANGNGGAGGSGAGGAIYAAGSSTITASTFSGNSATGGTPADSAGNTSHFTGSKGLGGPDAFGGGLYNAGTNVTVNCTFTSNIVSGGIGAKGGNGLPYAGDGGDGGSASGGNGYNQGAMAITNCTFASGAARPGAGGASGSGPVPGSTGSSGVSVGDNLASIGSSLFLKNTLLAYPLIAANTFGTITDGSNNLSSDNTPSSFVASERSVDPLLLTLRNNGGPTPTLAIATNSPAVNAGDCSGSPAQDQRGYSRNGNCDIGAYQTLALSPAAPSLTAVSLGSQLSLSWPGGAGTYTLQSSPDLSPPSTWLPVTNGIRTVGGISSITLPVANRSQFFRLRQ